MAKLSISHVGGVKTISIGTPGDNITNVVCEGGVTLEIFDLSTTPIYTIIPSVLSLNSDLLFKLVDGIFGVMKKPKDAPLVALFEGIHRMINPQSLTEVQATKYKGPHSCAGFYYLLHKENKTATNLFLKKQISFFPDVLHSMQTSDDEPVFELCKVEGSTFAELTSALFACLEKDNDSDFSEVLPLVAKFLTVRKGFTGDSRETPIPHASKGSDGGMDIKTCHLPLMKNMPCDFIDLMAMSMFRHIGVRLSCKDLVILLTELLYSKITLNEGVKEVLEELLGRYFVMVDQAKFYSEPTNLSMWQTSKLVSSISDVKRTNGEIAAFIFLFQEWYLDTNQVKNKFERMAGLFGFDLKFLHKKSLEVLNESLQKEKKGFTFKKWLSLVSTTWSKGQTSVGGVELPTVFDGLYNATFEPTLRNTKKFDALVDILKSEGIEFGECTCCSNLYLKGLVKGHTKACEVCESSGVCIGCNKKLYGVSPVEGHVLNMSSVSCMCCRTVFPSEFGRFPEGTLAEDIKEHSNEFYSCCVHGCNNFVHVVQEGVGCADRPDTVVDVFCATHDYMNFGVMREMHKQCPGCHVMVMKSEGCNHMTCHCRAEFCMREGCSYVKPQGGSYQHNFYCRHGISDGDTRRVMFSILHDMQRPTISQELNQSIRIRLQRIIYDGFEMPLRHAIWDMLDLISAHRPIDPVVLRTRVSNVYTQMDVYFPSTN
jgi:hypothetical protein